MAGRVRGTRLSLLLCAVLMFCSTQPRASAQDQQRCFPETGFCISGRFRSYWEQNGGLPVFGYPVTAPQNEPNRDTGETYLTQWFERTRFELHPNNLAPYDVLLGRLGSDLLARQGRDWQAWAKADPAAASYFPETGQAIDPVFLAYWTSHGLDLGDPGISRRESLALFGAPLSPPSFEHNTDGDRWYTQWFERGRFESNSSRADDPDLRVLLGRVSAEIKAYDLPATSGRIAFVRGDRVGVVNPVSRTYTLFPSTDGVRSITGLVWSPDGQQIAVEAGQQLYVVSADGSQLRKIAAPGRQPTWSPNSQRIVYTTSTPDATGDLYVIDAAGAGRVQLTSGPRDDRSPVWSPAGQQIAFVASPSDQPGNSAVFTITADGSGLRQLTEGGADQPAWSPDGQQLAFVSRRDGDAEIAVMRPDGSGQRALTANSDQDSAPVWSPNGQQLLFRRQTPPYPIAVVMNSDGSAQTTIPGTGSGSWSPDSRYIAWDVINQTMREEIFVTSLDGSQPSFRFLVEGLSPAWSPK